MPDISLDELIAQLLAILQEAFEGPQQSWSYFTDHGAEAGLFGTLEELSPAEASRPAGGTTIAAHAHHTAFALAASSAWIRGDRASRNWQESWSVAAVDEAAWRRLRQELRGRYSDLRRSIESHASGSIEAMGGSVAAIAHAVYHLGAIRQKVAASREG